MRTNSYNNQICALIQSFMKRSRIAQYKGYWSETVLLTVLNFGLFSGSVRSLLCHVRKSGLKGKGDVVSRLVEVVVRESVCVTREVPPAHQFRHAQLLLCC